MSEFQYVQPHPFHSTHFSRFKFSLHNKNGRKGSRKVKEKRTSTKRWGKENKVLLKQDRWRQSVSLCVWVCKFLLWYLSSLVFLTLTSKDNPAQETRFDSCIAQSSEACFNIAYLIPLWIFWQYRCHEKSLDPLSSLICHFMFFSWRMGNSFLSLSAGLNSNMISTEKSHCAEVTTTRLCSS